MSLQNGQQTMVSTPVQDVFKESVPQQGRIRQNSLWSNAYGLTVVHEKSPSHILPISIQAFLYFNDAPKIEDLRSLVRDRLLQIPRFRSILKCDQKSKNSKTFWEELSIDEVDMCYHVTKENEIFSNKRLLEYCCAMYKERLDVTKPLWKFVLIPLEDGRHCLSIFVYHCLADGTALVQTLTRCLMDPVDYDGSNDPALKGEAPKKRKKPSFGFFKRASIAAKGTGKAVMASLLPADTSNVLKLKDHRRPSPDKKFAFTDSIDLDKIKAISKRYPGTTVNDVMLAVMTIALRKFYEQVDDPALKKKNIRVRGSVPIDMRKPGSAVMTEKGYGNQVSFCTFQFPLKTPTLQLVYDIKRQVDQLKVSPEGIVQKKLLKKVLQVAPTTKIPDLFLDSAGKFTASLSNVRGPGSIVYLGGKPVNDLQFISGNPLGLYFGCLTYNNKMSASVCLDSSIQCDAEALASQWIPAFEELFNAVNETEGNIVKRRSSVFSRFSKGSTSTVG